MVIKYMKGTCQGMANVFAIVVFITATLLLLHGETYMLVFCYFLQTTNLL